MNRNSSYWLAIACCLIVTATGALAQRAGDNGLGIIIGDPTGVSFKHWMDATRAWDAAAAWDLEDDETLHLHADYLWHDFSLNAVKDNRNFGWYYGVGARFVAHDDNGRGRGNNDDDDDTFGVRVPFGFDYFFPGKPLEAFLEVAPALELIPETDLDFDIGLGIRFYFR